MTELIQPPSPGGSLEASWGAAVTEGVNRMEQMFPSGGLARQYAGGCGFAPLPVNNRGFARTGGISPFAVRYVEENEDAGIPYTGFEIYMPAGCVAVGSTCQPMNPPAYRNKDGVREDLDGWYRMPYPGDTPEDGDAWPVKVHAKCCAAISGVDEFEDWPKQYLWANIEKNGLTQQERETDQNDVGDTFSTTVGVIGWHEVEKDDGTTEMRSYYSHAVKTAINVMDVTAATLFLLFFAFEVDADSVELTFDRLFVRNRAFTAAGATYVADGLTEIETDVEAVYLKISANTSPYTGEIKSYKTISDPQGDTLTVPSQAEADKDVGEILVRLYTLKNGHVTGNYLSALQNIQLYQ